MAFVVGLVFATVVVVGIAQRTAIVQRPSEAPPFDVDLEAGVVRIRPTSPNDSAA